MSALNVHSAGRDSAIGSFGAGGVAWVDGVQRERGDDVHGGVACFRSCRGHTLEM